MLGHGVVANDSFNFRVTDEYGMSGSRQVNVAVVGTDPAPVGPAPVVFDGRNAFDGARLRAAGFEYSGIGKP